MIKCECLARHCHPAGNAARACNRPARLWAERLDWGPVALCDRCYSDRPEGLYAFEYGQAEAAEAGLANLTRNGFRR
jgi:hypothetical protein